MKHFADITPDLVAALDMRAAEEDYRRQARLADKLAGVLEELGMTPAPFDAMASDYRRKANDVRVYRSQ